MTLKQEHIFVVQIMFTCGVLYSSQGWNFKDEKSFDFGVTSIARFVLYLLMIKATKTIPNVINDIIHTVDNRNNIKILKQNWLTISMFFASIYIVKYFGGRLFNTDFLFLMIANIIINSQQMIKKAPTISYGVGMACSFFEGYLAHIIPSDGAMFVGFQENINIYENKEGVIFPVKKLFLIIPKKLYCPPDLKEFNKPNRPDLAYLEACKSLKDVEKDVAGVKNRTYRNSAYKIHRPHSHLEPVYIAAECATPLHTLHKVVERKSLYKELADMDVDEIVKDFCTMLQSILNNSSDCCNKCELVFFDNTDPNQNLADFLLRKIKELEPNFEKITSK